jgi:hypothetical protein
MGFYAQKILPLVFDKGGNTPEFNGYRQRLLTKARERSRATRVAGSEVRWSATRSC